MSAQIGVCILVRSATLCVLYVHTQLYACLCGCVYSTIHTRMLPRDSEGVCIRRARGRQDTRWGYVELSGGPGKEGYTCFHLWSTGRSLARAGGTRERERESNETAGGLLPSCCVELELVQRFRQVTGSGYGLKFARAKTAAVLHTRPRRPKNHHTPAGLMTLMTLEKHPFQENCSFCELDL